MRLHITPPGLLRQSADVISFLWKFRVAGNNKTYLGFHGKWQIFFLDFSNIWIFSTDYPKSPQYQISWNVGALADTYWETDGYYEALTRAFLNYVIAHKTSLCCKVITKNSSIYCKVNRQKIWICCNVNRNTAGCVET